MQRSTGPVFGLFEGSRSPATRPFVSDSLLQIGQRLAWVSDRLRIPEPSRLPRKVVGQGARESGFFYANPLACRWTSKGYRAVRCRWRVVAVAMRPHPFPAGVQSLPFGLVA